MGVLRRRKRGVVVRLVLDRDPTAATGDPSRAGPTDGKRASDGPAPSLQVSGRVATSFAEGLGQRRQRPLQRAGDSGSTSSELPRLRVNRRAGASPRRMMAAAGGLLDGRSVDQDRAAAERTSAVDPPTPAPPRPPASRTPRVRASSRRRLDEDGPWSGAHASEVRSAGRPATRAGGWQPPEDDPRALWQVIRERRASGELPHSPARARPGRGGAGTANGSVRLPSEPAPWRRPPARRGRVSGPVVLVGVLGICLLVALGSFAYISRGGGTARAPGAAASSIHLVLSAPASVEAGVPFSVAVTAESGHDRALRSFAGTVHFSTTYAGAGVRLPSQFTFAASDRGTHRFVDSVRLLTSGDQLLTASDPGTLGVASGVAPIRVVSAPATRLLVSAPPAATAGSPFSVTVTALDRFGNVATGFRGPVELSTSDRLGGVVLPHEYVFTAADAGVHTFTDAVTLVGDGRQSLRASDPTSRAIAAGAQPLPVVVAPAIHLAVDAPATVFSGAPFSLTVVAEGRGGTIASGYTGTVHFTTSDAGAGVSLPANFTFVRADHGRHTFVDAVTLATGGEQTVSAVDTSQAGVEGTSAAIAVSDESATRLLLSTPATVRAGSPFSLTVTALNENGSIDSAFRGTVQFGSIDSGTGIRLPPDYTFVRGDDGVHTFSGGAELVTVGTERLTAVDAGLRSVSGTSPVITVIPGPAKRLEIAAPARVAAGAPFTVTVTALDAYGNTAPAFTGAVRVSTVGGRPSRGMVVGYSFRAADRGVHAFVRALSLEPGSGQRVIAIDPGDRSLTGSSSLIAVVSRP